MKLAYTYCILLLFLLSCITETLSQSYNNNSINHSFPYITAEFTRESVIIDPDATLFNVLVIKNKGERREEVFIEINVPIGWSVMAAETRSHFINPGDSILIPVRAAPAKGVEGEIGYSLIAAINERSGENFTNAYCFVKIVRKSELRFRPITRVSYFDQQTGQSTMSFRIDNRGNVSELIYISLQSTKNVSVLNERDNLFNMDFLLKARSDTVITIPVKVVDNKNLKNGSLFRVDLKGSTQESTFGTSFWFNHLVSNYKYDIPESEKMLIAEIAAQNLLSNQPVVYSGGFKGNLLLPKKRDFNYIFYRYGSGSADEFLKYSRVKFSYNTPKLNLTIGDITGLSLKYGGGRGAEIRYRFADEFQTIVAASQNNFKPIKNFSLGFEEKYTSVNIATRLSYSQNMSFNNESYVANARGVVKLNQDHRIRADVGLSSVNYNDAGISAYGYGFLLDYNGKFDKTTVRIKEQFGSTDYYGQFTGRHDLSARIFHPLNSGLELDLNATDQRYKPSIESSSGVVSNRFLDNTRVNFTTLKHVDRGFSIYGGPIYERKSTNTFFLYDGITPFTTHSAKIVVGTRVNDGSGLTFNPSLTVGYSFITEYSIPDPDIYRYNINNRDKSLFNSHLSFNLRSGWWGTYLNYFYGPYSVNQEITDFYYNINAHSVRVMPYLERFIYKDMVRLSTKLSFLYDFAFKTSRLNLSNQLDIFLKYDITLSVLNTYSYQLTTDLITDDKYTYSNLYFEVRLTKAFNFNQPRIKYYDLKINLYKDVNGNLKRESNEPGVKDILVNITSIEPSQSEGFDAGMTVGKMVSTKLLSGMDGTVKYENLARGFYKVELENVGKDQDKYFPDQKEFIVQLTGDEVLYVPYLERNKIFGRVVLNRSRLSNLGRIEVSNIKVTAVDSKGRAASALTDINGYFEMYVPSVDHYIVTINNIFKDHFNLRQNDFRANLNGFKQFEVNYVFDEIRRTIEFAPTALDFDAEIRKVGRANLNGMVRDASTLQPLRAQIDVIDTKTGNNIVQTVSDRGTGRYSASFVTGENYQIVLSANGYWMHTDNLSLDQFLTIQDIERDVLLEVISIGARFALNNLRFAPGSSELITEALPELDRLIEQLKQNPNVRIRIEGHSDAVETLDYPNIAMQRAEVVMRYMVKNGFSNIEFTGRKDSQPLAPSDTEENRRRNRRVEIIIIDR
ncbi:MAG: OmpA family protein [Bacteroidetes bacterium]|nr:OmpA family protein [Bacteroidota bacterium]